jgi:hypothetical protein
MTEDNDWTETKIRPPQVYWPVEDVSEHPARLLDSQEASLTEMVPAPPC